MMPKYLFTASYTTDGVKGLVKEGGTGRRDAVAKLAASAGGSVESFYYAFGSDDAFVVVDLPDHEAASAVALTVAASGAVQLRTTVLLTPEEIDAAAGRAVEYRPPGS